VTGPARFPKLCSSFVGGKTYDLANVFGTYRWKSSARILALLVDPDDRTILTGGWDNEVKVWDATTGEQTARLTGHGAAVRAIAWRPPRRTVITTSDDGTLGEWDLATKKRLRTLRAHDQSVIAAAVSPDGRLVATGSEDGVTKLWDLEDGRLVASFPMSERACANALAFSPDGTRWLAGGSDGSLVVRDRSGTTVSTLVRKGPTIRGCAFFPDGKRFVTGGGERVVTIHDLATGATERLEGHTDTIIAVAVSPDGTRVVSGSRDTSVRIWDVSTRACTKVDFHIQDVNAVAVTSDGRHVLSGSLDNRIGRFDLATGSVDRSEADPLASDAIAQSVAISPDGGLAVVGMQGGAARRIDLVHGAELAPVATGPAVFWPAFSPDGKTILTASYDGRVVLWDARMDQSIAALHPGSVPARSPVYLDARHAVTAHDDGTLRTWDLEARAETKTTPLHDPTHGAFWLERVGSTLLSACRCGFVATEGPGPLVTEALPTWPVALARLGPRRVVGAAASEIRAWDVATGAVAWTIRAESVLTVAVTDDGRLVAAALAQAKILLLDGSTGREVDRIDLASSSDRVNKLAFAPDRSLLAATSRGVVLRFRPRG
jgi:WD40 repeat protein